MVRSSIVPRSGIPGVAGRLGAPAKTIMVLEEGIFFRAQARRFFWSIFSAFWLLGVFLCFFWCFCVFLGVFLCLVFFFFFFARVSAIFGGGVNFKGLPHQNGEFPL